MIPSILDKKIRFIISEDEGEVFSNKKNPKVVKTLYANLLTVTNSETIQAYSKDESIILSFRVINTKWTKELLYKTKDYQILFNNLTYDIIAAVPKGINYIDIKCKVVI